MLPTFNRNNRRTTFVQLPKDAYVIKILSAKIANAANGSPQLIIAFDIAEGEYKDFYKGVFDRNSNEDKKWPNGGVFKLWIPTGDSPEYSVRDWDSFFADLEDSNAGFVFNGDEKTLKGKVVGAKMRIRQYEVKGNVYDSVEMKWSCVADDVRNGKAGRLPNDKLIQRASAPAASANAYVNSFTSADSDEIPFD